MFSHMTEVVPDFIPAELKDIPLWANWTPEPRRGGGFNKRPLTPNTLLPAAPNNQLQFGTFREAMLARNKSLTAYGIGLLIDGRFGIVAGDIDNCVLGEGQVTAAAQAIIDSLDTYTEYSPSGNGLRFFCKAKLKKNYSRPHVLELYSGIKPKTDNSDRTANHFVTITGRVFGEPKPIRECTAELLSIVDQYFPEQEKTQGRVIPQAVPYYAPDPNDSNVINKMIERNPRAAALWYGDTSAYGNDYSRADEALCTHIAYWGNYTDPADIIRVFRQSGLYQAEGRAEKWESIHSGDGLTYGQMTALKALAYRKAARSW